MPKMTLLEASKLLGLSVNGLRSRAKKDPARYGLSVDNGGRLWLDFEPSNLSASKPSRKPAKQSSNPSLEVENAVLRSRVELLEADRDHWRDLAKTLAARRRRWWLF